MSNYDGTQFAYEPIPEDSIEGLRVLWAPIAAHNSMVSQHLIEAQSLNLGASQMFARLRPALSWMSVLSTDQTDYYDCQLPYQLPHTFSHGYICQSDSVHRFCFDHVLTKCVICGGDLTYE
jgi:hypothetical protein